MHACERRFRLAWPSIHSGQNSAHFFSLALHFFALRQVSLQCDTRGPASILGRIADIADDADTETGIKGARGREGGRQAGRDRQGEGMEGGRGRERDEVVRQRSCN